MAGHGEKHGEGACSGRAAQQRTYSHKAEATGLRSYLAGSYRINHCLSDGICHLRRIREMGSHKRKAKYFQCAYPGQPVLSET